MPQDSLTPPARALDDPDEEPTPIAKSPRRSRLANLSPTFCSVPGIDCHAPRDGQWIERTSDILFLAVLLERSRSHRYVRSDKQPDGSLLYTPCDTINTPPGKGQPRYTRTSRLYGLDNLWRLRKLIQAPKPPCKSISIGIQTLCRDGEWVAPVVELTLAHLRHPIRIGQPDAFLAALSTQRYFTWCDLQSTTPCTLPDIPIIEKINPRLRTAWHDDVSHVHPQIICPLCGPVTPIKVRTSAPAEIWRMSCGRAYEALHCPHCLAHFTTQLTSMS